MPGTLSQRVARQMAAAMHPSVAAFAQHLAQAAGAQAALFYGSNLRTGELEGVLDFYLLLPGPQREKIWPRVSYHEWEHDGHRLRAKVATLAFDTFQRAARGKTRDTTIWARFVQPSALAWAQDDAAADRARQAVADAARTAARLAAVLGPQSGREEDYWRALFRATYKAEFRVEKPGREDTILAANPAHYEGLIPAALEADGQPYTLEGGILTPQIGAEDRRYLLGWWRGRALRGKPINFLRLLKASTTFEGAARYAAWKIERHTGVAVEVTPWRERHPVLAAPGVLWKVWRARK